MAKEMNNYYFSSEEEMEQGNKTYNEVEGHALKVNGMTLVSAEEDRLMQLADKRNKIRSFIKTKVTDSKTYRQALNMISDFSHCGSEIDVYELSKMLEEAGESLIDILEETRQKLNKQSKELEAYHYVPSVDEIQRTNIEVDYAVNEILAQMGNIKDTNRRRIGTMVHNADRTNALALLKVSTFPQYTELFNDRQIRELHQKSKTQVQVYMENENKRKLDENNKKLAKVYMDSFMLSKAMDLVIRK